LTEGKTHQKGSKRRLLITLKEILRRRKNNEENSDRLLRRKWWGNIVFFSKDTNRSSLAGEYGFNVLSAKCGPMKNALLAFPGDIFFPTASRMYQMKIFEFCGHIFLYCISFSIVLSFVRTVNQFHYVVNS
jgi:hypothetical protein